MVVVLEVEATSEVAITGSRRTMVVDIVVREVVAMATRMAVVGMAEVVDTEEDMAVRVDMVEVVTLATQLGR